MKTLGKQITLVLALFLLSSMVCAEEELRGLWVGQVTLTHVNQVTIPLDENNNLIAPDPDIPTNTADAAHLRVILHVNGAGQVNLLKDVAILQRSDVVDTNRVVLSSEGHLALVSDERLYDDFETQTAMRIASAVFDFGDFKATEAVDALVDEIAAQVAYAVSTSTVSATSSLGDIAQAKTSARTAAETGVANRDLLEGADVAAEFALFMQNSLTSLAVETIATTGVVSTNILNAAADLASTFYEDTRAIDVVQAISNVYADTSMSDEEKKEEGLFIAARYKDVENLYQRFITSDEFGDMIPLAAHEAAVDITNGLSDNTVSNNVLALALDASSAHISQYSDTAAQEAVDAVLNAIVDAALSSTNEVKELIHAEAEVAGIEALANVRRFSMPLLTPTGDYTTFVNSAEFMDCVPGAAAAAAKAAVEEKQVDLFSTSNSLDRIARIGALNALKSVYILAAKARRTELPMVGNFGPDGGGLECEVNLPASHPTNPFRHPKHPDHTVGINITRYIQMDFDDEAPGPSATGLDQVEGIYREEVFGLHKPLGPNQNIGLKVEGTFELNRVSRIDTLNAQ